MEGEKERKRECACAREEMKGDGGQPGGGGRRGREGGGQEGVAGGPRWSGRKKDEGDEEGEAEGR